MVISIHHRGVLARESPHLLITLADGLRVFLRLEEIVEVRLFVHGCEDAVHGGTREHQVLGKFDDIALQVHEERASAAIVFIRQIIDDAHGTTLACATARTGRQHSCAQHHQRHAQSLHLFVHCFQEFISELIV